MYLLKSDVFMCPALGGDAVYKARSIHILFNDTIEYNDELACLNAGIQYRKANTEKHHADFAISIFPNPTKDLLMFQGLEHVTHPVQIVVTNMLGQEVLSTNCLPGHINLNVSKLPSGVYGIKLISKIDTILFNNKFVKI